MRRDLGPDAGLHAETGDGDDGGLEAADAGRGQAGGVVWVSEEGAVVGVEDVDGEVWVGVGELVVQLCLERAVDGVPDIFIANVGNGCSTVEGKHTVFENPGDNVVYADGTTADTPPFPDC